MKTRKNSWFGGMISWILPFIFIFGCSMQDEPVIDQEELNPVTDKTTHARQVNQEGTVMLSGIFNYFTFATKTGEILQDMDLMCEILLEFSGGDNIQLTNTEQTPAGPRTSVLIGKITPGGRLIVSYPSPLMELPDGSYLNITDIIQGHSGCELSGPGINNGTLVFHGSFDGERLTASAIFNSQCDVHWDANDLFDTPVDGPVHWKWSMDVTVD